MKTIILAVTILFSGCSFDPNDPSPTPDRYEPPSYDPFYERPTCLKGKLCGDTCISEEETCRK